MFESFFNYPLSVWQNSQLFFASGWSWQAWVLVAALSLLVLWFSLWRQPLSHARRTLVGLLQGTAVLSVLLMLWQPALRVSVIQSGENTVAYLLDGSRSMHFQDAGQRDKRINQVSSALKNDAGFDSEVFDVSLYAITDNLETLENLADMPPASSRTGLADALMTVLDTVGQQSLAAVVLFSDGNNNVGTLSVDWWQRIKQAGVPIHTIGVGPLNHDHDIELADVIIDPVATPDTPVTARIRVLHGAQTSTRLRITAGADLLLAEDLALQAGASETLHSVTFNSGTAGVRELMFAVESAPGESNTVNNRQPRVLMVGDERKRVLYIEGEPRWEYKFIRRALHDFASVEVVSLLRTSANKFYRQGVRDADELANGFPLERESLYAYDAVIIGSLEAAELSLEQQSNLRDFVNIRGGSLLMLAGSNGLADGAWERSAVAVALPVVLKNRNDSHSFIRQRAQLSLTQQGRRARWLQFSEDAEENEQAWLKLPEVADYQEVGEPKPGAVVLLTRQQQGNKEPVLVWQRYGQGQSYVLGSSGTWRWQMRLPSTDQHHELFWQQFLAQLVSTALPQYALLSDQPVHRDAAEVSLSVLARNADFTPMQRATLEVTVNLPTGPAQNIALTPVIERPGQYTGMLDTPLAGAYSITIASPLAGEASPALSTATLQRWWVSEHNSAENFSAIQNTQLLKRLAEHSGGRYLPLADLDQLPGMLSVHNSALKREDILPLWNMPIFFLLLLLSKGLEWLLRLRWKRL